MSCRSLFPHFLFTKPSPLLKRYFQKEIMTIKLVAFGIAKDILKNKSIDFAVAEKLTVADLKADLCAQYPEFQRLKSFAIAINEEYQDDDFVIGERDEVVIIPPVSGG